MKDVPEEMIITEAEAEQLDAALAEEPKVIEALLDYKQFIGYIHPTT